MAQLEGDGASPGVAGVDHGSDHLAVEFHVQVLAVAVYFIFLSDFLEVAYQGGEILIVWPGPRGGGARP